MDASENLYYKHVFNNAYARNEIRRRNLVNLTTNLAYLHSSGNVYIAYKATLTIGLMEPTGILLRIPTTL